jgi:hypothetical protein
MVSRLCCCVLAQWLYVVGSGGVCVKGGGEAGHTRLSAALVMCHVSRPCTPPTGHRNAPKAPKSSSPLTPVHGELFASAGGEGGEGGGWGGEGTQSRAYQAVYRSSCLASGPLQHSGPLTPEHGE